MIFSIFITFCVSSVFGYAPLREPGAGMYNDVSFIQDVLERMNRDLDVGASGNAFMDLGNRMDEMSPLRESAFGRTAKDAEMMDGLDYEMLLNGAANPSIRDTEYLQHSSLWGHKYMSGGGSEGSQKLKGGQGPTEIKTDAILPAYCNPPNPCPVGYTAEDGCIETFENTAAFSRAYQASQDCMCDTEHMFECPAPRDSDVDLSAGNDFLNDLQQQLPGEHKSLVAKKFYNKKSSHDEELARLSQLAHHAAMVGSVKPEGNPFLQGEKLPIAAKKGHHAQHQEPQLNL